MVLKVSTSHLESLGNVRARAQQGRTSLGWLDARAAQEGCGDVVFMGDTNIADGLSSDGRLEEPVDFLAPAGAAAGGGEGEGAAGGGSAAGGWRDAWEVCHPPTAAGDPGGSESSSFTFDVERNRMVKRLDGWARKNGARVRLERFWVRLSNYRCGRCELVGTEPLAVVTTGGPAEGEWWPSDHFGVLLTLNRLPRTAAAGDGLSDRDREMIRLQAEYDLLS